MIMYGVPLRVAITSARRSWLLIKVAVNAPDQAFQPGFNYSQDVYHCLTSLGTVSSKSPGADLSVAPLSTFTAHLGGSTNECPLFKQSKLGVWLYATFQSC